MRKVFLIFGVILVLAGILVSSRANLSVEKIETSLVNSEDDKYEVSGNFSEGEKMLAHWTPPNWEKIGGAIPNGEWVVYYITVLAPPPENGETNFTVKLYNRGGANVTVSSNGGGLSDFSSIVVGGVAQLSGTYTVYMDESAGMYYENSPPSYFELLTEVVKTEYPHRDALPIGVALIVVGSAFSIWSAKSSKRILRPRKKRR